MHTVFLSLAIETTQVEVSPISCYCQEGCQEWKNMSLAKSISI